ncbi:MAG: response regulator transcription factor [Chloroflexi bacterium]|nr:response regulator transcription factor [Chloroflexota bacterium]
MSDEHILVVEDDPSIGALIRLLLEEAGWAASIARDGATAVRVAAGEKPALALLDVHLPGPDAAEVARSLRRVCGPSLPLIATSATDERSKAALLGACAFLDKPFDIDQLVGTVEKVLDVRRRFGLTRPADDLRQRAERARLRLVHGRTGMADLARWQAHLAAGTAAHILGDAVADMGAAGGSLVLCGRAYTLQVAATVGFPDEVGDLWREFPSDAPMPIADAANGWQVWLPSLEDGLDRYPDLLGSLSTSPWAESLCAVPLVVGRTSIGALGLVYDRREGFGREVRARMLELATDVADRVVAAPSGN